MSQAEEHRVNGVLVVEERPVVSPLPNPRDGSVMHFPRMVELVLEDDSTVFGCRECDFTAPTRQALGHHLGHVHGKPKREPASVVPAGWEDITLGEVVAIGRRLRAMDDALHRMTEDRNEWKDRARAAERDLGAIHRALGKAVR